jgi:hypothetical protein
MVRTQMKPDCADARRRSQSTSKGIESPRKPTKIRYDASFITQHRPRRVLPCLFL